MKKIVAIFLTVFTCAALAGTQAALPLKGKISLLLGISITAVPAASSLNLYQSQTDLKVADGQVYSNSGTGFKVIVTSANQGRLKRTSGNEYFPYTLKFGSIPVTLSSTTPVVYTYGGILNYTDKVSISYNGAAAGTLVAGDYVDTITFTISAL